MQYFGTEGRHFSGFRESDFRNWMCFFDQTRIGRVDTRYVSPDLQFINTQRFGQQCSTEIAATTTQRGSLAVSIGTDKALGDHDVIFQQRCHILLCQIMDRFNGRRGAAKTAVSTHDFTDVKPYRFMTQLIHHFGKQAGRHQFALCHKAIFQCRIAVLSRLTSHVSDFF
eukprot:RCo023385